MSEVAAMELLEVIKKAILPLLGWNDLLRLRRTCKDLEHVVTEYLRAHPELAPEIEINEEDKTFAEYLKMGIPSTRFFINNQSGDKFYGKDMMNMYIFLLDYGTLVKHLRVHELGLYIFGNEWDFLDFLCNLETLEAHRFGLGKNVGKNTELQKFKEANQDARYLMTNPPVPGTFRNLKRLKIGQDEKLLIENISNRHDGFLNLAKKLEYLGLPLGLYWDVPYRDCLQTYALAFAVIMDHFLSSRKRPPLKIVDFGAYYNFMEKETADMEMVAAEAFANLLQIAVVANLKLENVGASWFWENVVYTPELGRPIKSLVNLPSVDFINYLEMPNLVRITIRATSQCKLRPRWCMEPPKWPALQVLDINVDSVWDAEIQFRFLFEGVRHLGMKELRLNSMKGKDQVATPKVEDIVASCPSLKKLTLINWPGNNKELVGFWKGLPGLEEVTLDNCKDMGNLAFIGFGTKTPVFLKLKNLRKLALKNVDNMPKITDRLFTSVIRHLRLKQFILTSEKPIEKVTVVGILALLEGQFAEYIEKFPFQGWTLQEMEPEEFKSLEKWFRSSNML